MNPGFYNHGVKSQVYVVITVSLICDSTQLPGKENLKVYQTAHFMLPVLISLEDPKELVGW